MSTNVTSALQQGPRSSDWKGYASLQMWPIGGDLPSAASTRIRRKTSYSCGIKLVFKSLHLILQTAFNFK